MAVALGGRTSVSERTASCSLSNSMPISIHDIECVNVRLGCRRQRNAHERVDASGLPRVVRLQSCVARRTKQSTT